MHLPRWPTLHRSRAATSPSPPDLWRAPALLQLQAMAEQQLSAGGLLQEALRRMAQLDDTAAAEAWCEDARRQAAQADATRAAGVWRPLLGLPVLLTRAAGVAAADPALEEAARALHRAGAVVLADVRMPWPAGLGGRFVRSGAASLALCWGADDADDSALGAARALGLHAHRPSPGLVGLRGARRGRWPTMLARDAADLELLLDVLLAYDEDDAQPWRTAVPPARSPHLSALRLLWLDDAHGVAPRLTRREAAGALSIVDGLRLHGAVVERRRCPREAALPLGDWQRHDAVLVPWSLPQAALRVQAAVLARGDALTVLPLTAGAVSGAVEGSGVYVLGPPLEDRTPLVTAQRITGAP